MSDKEKNTKNPNVSEENLEFEKVKKPTKLELAQKEAADYKDMALRKMAEFENYRKNNQNIAKDTRERVIGEVIAAFLPALDAFARAEQMISDEKTKSGINIIKDQLFNVLKRYDVTPMSSVDKDYNPAEEECIMQVESPDKAGKVIYEIEKGYYMNGKVLRYAKVAVGKETETNNKNENNSESEQNCESKNNSESEK